MLSPIEGTRGEFADIASALEKQAITLAKGNDWCIEPILQAKTFLFEYFKFAKKGGKIGITHDDLKRVNKETSKPFTPRSTEWFSELDNISLSIKKEANNDPEHIAQGVGSIWHNNATRKSHIVNHYQRGEKSELDCAFGVWVQSL